MEALDRSPHTSTARHRGRRSRCSLRRSHSQAAASPTTMSRRGSKMKAVDLKLNLALPAVTGHASSARRGSSGSDDDSSQSSCVSSESESAAAAMVLAACPHCLMYVMLAEDDTKCPKCKSAVLLDFLHGKNKTRKS